VSQEPGQERRAFVAILLAMGVLFLWSVIFPSAKRPPREALAPGAADSAQVVQQSEAPRDSVALVDDSAQRAGSPQLAKASSAEPTGEARPSLLGLESAGDSVLRPAADAMDVGPVTVTVEGEDLVLEIDGRGARIISAALPTYRGPEGGPVELVPAEEGGAAGSVLIVGEREIPLDQFVFQLVEDSGSYGSAARKLVWELRLEEVTLRKTYTIPPEGNVFGVEHDLVRDDVGAKGWGLSWAGGMRVTEVVKRATRGSYFNGSVLAEGKVQRKSPANLRKAPFEFPGHTYFVTIQNKYFVGAIVPRGQNQGPARLWIVPGRGPQDEGSVGGEILVDRSRGVAADHVGYDVYVGPLDYDKMAAQRSLANPEVSLGIEQAVDLGYSWVRPLSRLVLRMLIWLHSFIPNYGVVIILFSAMTNILFFPLTYKSTKSMRDMAALKPRIDALKAKYKDEPQKLSEATMRLYKEAGVNPLGGCLPLLLQMPIFFALYAVLFRTIELRGAPFVFWIKDLAQPDVVFNLPFSLPLIGSGIALLPIIMGVTSYFQAKQTTADPNQKSMTVIMPVVMTLIFFSFPSGLVLYWLTSNLLTIGQKFLMKPSAALAEAAAEKSS
jgi:YidC/Oxa1 family membrane protein insertase